MEDKQTFTFAGRVDMPRSWKALYIERTEKGSIVWAERRSWGERLMDRLEEFVRRYL